MKHTSLRMLAYAGISTAFWLSSTVSVGAALYTPVSCDSQSFFKANTCDLCYEEKTPILPGMQLSGLFDTWINPNATPQHVYEDEQKIKPIMINFGGSGTVWKNSSANHVDMWEFTPEVVWTTTGATNRRVSIVKPGGASMKFIQMKPNASITLQSTDIKKGEFIGMMKFPLTYRDVDAIGNEGEGITHYECVTYRSGHVPPVIETPKPTPPPAPITVSAPAPKPASVVAATPPPAPKQITATKTGPELWIAAIIALMLAPMIMFMKKRRI